MGKLEEYRGISYRLEKKNCQAKKNAIYFFRPSIKGSRHWRSTKCTNLSLAIKFVENFIDSFLDKQSGDITLKEYTKSLWDWEKCDYIKRTNRRRKDPLNRTYCDTNRRLLKEHIWKVLGNLKLREITTKDLQRFQDYLIAHEKSFSNTTINKIMSILHVIYKEAYRLDDVDKNLMKKIVPLSITKIERGILSKEQIKELFKADNLDVYWNNKIVYYAASLMALLTGMRLGEILALKWENVNFDDNLIHIKYSWDVKYGIRPTKNGEKYQVGMNSLLRENLLILFNQYTSKTNDSFVFCRDDHGTTMISRTTLRDNFYRALNRIGISEEERKEKNIVFHSLRHSFVSYGMNTLPITVVQKSVGHKNLSTTIGYHHNNQELVEKTIQFQNDMVS
ncbi:tyrosine-type recombinase/integrase [Marispirochaeta aestuarii]|uniref:tyrosine-type recombinase/integrase n=1 Tax=Marispirochaeta aestuarii TaxID=1963862 RepID=UPI002ABE330D|nr:tyrosine-type recombinase/integrase [Marispirochaeta aestuarii]